MTASMAEASSARPETLGFDRKRPAWDPPVASSLALLDLTMSDLLPHGFASTSSRMLSRPSCHDATSKTWSGNIVAELSFPERDFSVRALVLNSTDALRDGNCFQAERADDGVYSIGNGSISVIVDHQIGVFWFF